MADVVRALLAAQEDSNEGEQPAKKPKTRSQVICSLCKEWVDASSLARHHIGLPDDDLPPSAFGACLACFEQTPECQSAFVRADRVGGDPYATAYRGDDPPCEMLLSLDRISDWRAQVRLSVRSLFSCRNRTAGHPAAKALFEALYPLLLSHRWETILSKAEAQIAWTAALSRSVRDVFRTLLEGQADPADADLLGWMPDSSTLPREISALAEIEAALQAAELGLIDEAALFARLGKAQKELAVGIRAADSQWCETETDCLRFEAADASSEVDSLDSDEERPGMPSVLLGAYFSELLSRVSATLQRPKTPEIK